MNKQEIFNKVWTELNKQGGPSVQGAGPAHRGGFRCRYRGKNGRKCAVGCFLPDNQYNEDYEGGAFYSIPSVMAVVGHDILSQEGRLLSDLRRAHDGAARQADENGEVSLASDAEWLRAWRKRMRDIATEHGLEVPSE